MRFSELKCTVKQFKKMISVEFLIVCPVGNWDLSRSALEYAVLRKLYLLRSLCSIPGLNRCCFMHLAFRMVCVLVIKSSSLFVVLVNLWASVSTVTKLLLKVKIMNHVSRTCVTLRSVSTASQLSFV